MRLSRELAEIDAALERLYRKPERYGHDERTGEEIPFERLDPIPWARARVRGARRRVGQPSGASDGRLAA
jgi:RNA polymerase-binding transcription factor DksA